MTSVVLQSMEGGLEQEEDQQEKDTAFMPWGLESVSTLLMGYLCLFFNGGRNKEGSRNTTLSFRDHLDLW